ncbi:MAG: hypothetical protein HJJLKODD_01156 [Phycisphaerae bacterium]|nr:hypothetical protein [Phycisphaerae bacterium]
MSDQKWRLSYGLMVLALAVGRAAAQETAPPAISTTLSLQESIVPFSELPADQLRALGQTGRRQAWLEADGERWKLVIDGQSGPIFDEIRPWFDHEDWRNFFTRDEQYYSYVGRDGLNWHIVANGKKSPPYEEFRSDLAPLVSTPDRQAMAFIAEQDRQLVIVTGAVDQPKIFPLPDAGQNLIRETVGFSADARHFGFAQNEQVRDEQRGVIRKVRMIVDGQPLGLHYQVGPIRFSPSGDRVAYMTIDPDGDQRTAFFCHYHDQTLGPYQDADLNSLTLSPDGQHFAFIARKATAESNALFVITDRKEYGPYGSVERDSIFFTPDSQRVCFVAEEESNDAVQGRALLIFGDQTYGPYRYIEFKSVVLSPDYQRVACRITTGPNATPAIMVDGQISKTYDRVRQPVFSPDSKRLAFLAEFKGHALVVVDGQENRPVRHIADLGVVFSPDSQHYAYIAGTEQGQRVIRDGVPQPTSPFLDHVYQLIYTSDSTHLVTLAEKGLLVDNTLIQRHYSPRSLIGFESASRFSVVVLATRYNLHADDDELSERLARLTVEIK